MNQGGKQAAEPSRLENKRERRRGAAGRAAALRRAPSDSDCSGETASLSADSGDRAPRPPPLAPPRSGKTRSRRRGSEWEVLEGLKDGQRFEKRPDVFNGYLHKKRKWPLKGWHKRFFVVDGGILVYARSPTDVARGRLHGSVDVGLSVISAKARRRRIDIDADEFIYHLRAKTPEVFRTWLNVLKVHRLYRQHLLTFGARESAPKPHPPLEELPATDASSHASLETDTSTENSIINLPNATPSLPLVLPPIDIESSLYNTKDQNSILKRRRDTKSKSSLLPISMDEKMFDLKIDDTIYNNNRSMCSMQCVAKRYIDYLKNTKSPNISMNSTDAEKQMNYTYLESLINTQQKTESTPNDMPFHYTYSVEKINSSCPVEIPERKESPFLNSKTDTTTACFFFTRNRYKLGKKENQPLMKRSNKCTNLVRYKNLYDEPPLKMQSSKCMLLGKYKLQPSKVVVAEKAQHPIKSENLVKAENSAKADNPERKETKQELTNKGIACKTFSKNNNEVQVKIDCSKNKSSQNDSTMTDFDMITEKLMVSIFQQSGSVDNVKKLKYCIDQVVKDLYDYKVDLKLHPIKALFRVLLEYWLKNTSVTQFKTAMTCEKSIQRQSNRHFTRDENLSSYIVNMNSKETQCTKVIDIVPQHRVDAKVNTSRQKEKYDKKVLQQSHSPKRVADSFEKERRIQELERLLKSTVYVCETGCNNINKEKDIKITKRLIDNLEKLSRRNISVHTSDEKPDMEKLSSSTELPDIEDTINHLISETAIPPDVAKEFFGAYLDVLLQDDSKSSISQYSDSDKSQKNPVCEVVAESVVKKVSKSIATLNLSKECLDRNAPIQNGTITTEKQIDRDHLYLKDIVDKVTIVTSKKSHQNVKTRAQNSNKDELGRPTLKCSKNNLMIKNSNDNSLVINLSKYNLENISMINDPVIKGKMSITIKLKEKSPNRGESKRTHLSLKFSEDIKPVISNIQKADNWLSFINTGDSQSNDIFNKLPLDTDKICLDFETNGNITNVKPYWSTSDGTSKANNPLNECYSNESNVCSSDSRTAGQRPLPIHGNWPNFNDPAATHIKELIVDKNEDRQSCYIMSIQKKAGPSKLQKTRVRNQKCGCDSIFIQPRDQSPYKPADEKSLFDKPAPRVIDEKFILLLLENLTCLSKNIPALHKDINNLYMKLKKKYEKIANKDNYRQGLSLLGKIYSEDPYSKEGDDRGTQYDAKIDNPHAQLTKKDTNDASTNVYYECYDSPLQPSKKEVKHVSTNTALSRCPEEVKKDLNNTCTNTLPNTLMNSDNIDSMEKRTPNEAEDCKASTSHRNRITVTETETVDIESVDVVTSNPSWCKQYKDCGMNTIIKCIFCPGNSKNTPLTLAKTIKCDNNLKKRRNSTNVTQELIKEISLLSPSFKVSTQSQTDRQLIHYGDKRLEKEFNVHRLYLSNVYGMKASSSMMISSNVDGIADVSDDLKTLYRCSSDPSVCSGLLSPTTPTIRGPQAGFVSGTPGGRLAGWIIESGGPLDSASRELGQAQLSVQQLQRLLDALELQQQVHHDTDVSLEGASPNVKKDRRKFGLRKKKSNSKCASVELQPPHIDPSTSHTALSSLSALTAPPSPGGGACSMPNSAASLPIACAAARPQSLPGAEALNTAPGPASLTSLTPDHQLREDFTVLAKDLVASLKGIVSSLVCERGRLRAALEAAESTATPGAAVVAALRTNLTSALQQNSELRTRLTRIHDTSDIADVLALANAEAVNRQFQQSLSYSSSCVSASEFFDAEEHEEDDLKPEEEIAADEAGVIELDGDSSSEAGSLSSEEGSASSDNSEGAMLSAEQVTLRHAANGARVSGWTRRTRLPAPRASPGGPSLWNLLYKNIGKDLSQISMPVTINEPLNMLQRLCEELEYSELLDAAAECGSAVERAALVAAFAVSAYAASAHRAASKPFNPLLAETYECVRDDRGFRFLAEQVSHHPPISACHAESPRWCFWQEARIKTKFWGKSMEFQPTGQVHVRLTATGDHYTWNKVTTCVHNLFGGQRWVDQYGDMHIVCVGTDISCKLNFVKASSWSHTRHEVRGAVSDARSGARLRLAGRWSEALYAGEPPAARCLWRPGAMPPEHELYYGFTRFAMELNEMEPGMRELLPHTDTRLRPDQRALEEGDLEAAEAFKLELEQSQRERRRDSAQHVPAWFRKTIEDGEETWVFSGEYWKTREVGFSEDVAPRIW